MQSMDQAPEHNSLVPRGKCAALILVLAIVFFLVSRYIAYDGNFLSCRPPARGRGKPQERDRRLLEAGLRHRARRLQEVGDGGPEGDRDPPRRRDGPPPPRARAKPGRCAALVADRLRPKRHRAPRRLP